MITRDSYPAQIGCDLAVILYIKAGKDARVEHTVKVIGRRVGISGDPMFEISSTLTPGPDDPDFKLSPQSVPMIFPVGMMGVPAPGEYAIDVIVDGEKASEVPLTALPTAQHH